MTNSPPFFFFETRPYHFTRAPVSSCLASQGMANHTQAIAPESSRTDAVVTLRPLTHAVRTCSSVPVKADSMPGRSAVMGRTVSKSR